MIGYFVALLGFAQTPQYSPCSTTEYMEKLRKENPKMQTDAQFEQFMAQEIALRKSNNATNQRVGPYIINVIVHVIHYGQPVGTYPNITQAQIATQIRVLNEDFNRTNPDANTYWGATAAGMTGGIVFKLATIDPAGNILKEAGIHRYNGGQSSYTVDQIEANIKPVTSWDPTRYFNVWTVPGNIRASASVLYGGYAQFPEGSGLNGMQTVASTNAPTDGVVVNVFAFGSNFNANGVLLPPAQQNSNVSNFVRGHLMTHEIGHSLGLRHIWGDTNCGDDFCADTPTHKDPNSGWCSPHPKANTCGTADEMFENYMDYTSDLCINMFTAGQVARMVTVMDISPRRRTLSASNVSNCPVLSLTRTSGAYPAGVINNVYFQSNDGIGGAPTTNSGYSYVLGGTLPTGLSLNADTGAILGTPTTSGIYNFTITLKGAVGVAMLGLVTTDISCTSSTISYSINIQNTICPTINVLPALSALPNASIGVAYNQSIAASNGAAPYRYLLFAGLLPVGLTLSSVGVIEGVPTTTQNSSCFILVTDNNGCSKLVNYSVVVPCPTITISDTLPTGFTETPYSAQLQANGSGTNAVYRFSKTPSSSLPLGLAMSNTGLVTGTPINVENGSFSVTATNQFNCVSATTLVSLSITRNPTTSLNNSSNTLENQIKVYPNPNNGDFNIDFGTLRSNYQFIKLYDIHGKLLFSSTITSDLMAISMKNFTNGIYLLEVQTSKGRILKKLSKN